MLTSHYKNLHYLNLLRSVNELNKVCQRTLITRTLEPPPCPPCPPWPCPPPPPWLTLTTPRLTTLIPSATPPPWPPPWPWPPPPPPLMWIILTTLAGVPWLLLLPPPPPPNKLDKSPVGLAAAVASRANAMNTWTIELKSLSLSSFLNEFRFFCI